MRLALVLVLLIPLASRADAGEQVTFGRQRSALEQVRVKVEVTGKLKMVDGDKVAPVPIEAIANLEYHERRLRGPEKKLAGMRGVRYYQQAQAKIRADTADLESSLDDNRKLVVVDCAAEDRVPKLFSPSGPLTRNELDLIDVPGSSLVLDLLLPVEPQSVGDTWKPDLDVLAALVGLDVVGTSDVSFELTSVKDNRATVEAGGHLDGAIAGVASEMELKIRFYYDLKQQRMTRFGLAIREQRSIGHVAPGLNVTARVQIDREPLADSQWLSPQVLEEVPLDPNPAVLQLAHELPGGQLQFRHDRRWYVYRELPHMTILRLVDDGELLAQCNVNVLEKAEPGKHVAGDAFTQGVQEALGEKCQAIVHSGPVLEDTKLAVHQVIATGRSADLPIEWHYYLVADPAGHQASATFTVEQPFIERLGASDLEMLATFEFLAAPAGKPTPARSAESKSARQR